jgi:hypothetical protein
MEGVCEMTDYTATDPLAFPVRLSASIQHGSAMVCGDSAPFTGTPADDIQASILTGVSNSRYIHFKTIPVQYRAAIHTSGLSARFSLTNKMNAAGGVSLTFKPISAQMYKVSNPYA